jgi:hypothetical protein
VDAQPPPQPALHLLHRWWVASCPTCGCELARRRHQQQAERAGHRRRCPVCRPPARSSPQHDPWPSPCRRCPSPAGPAPLPIATAWPTTHRTGAAATTLAAVHLWRGRWAPHATVSSFGLSPPAGPGALVDEPQGCMAAPARKGHPRPTSAGRLRQRLIQATSAWAPPNFRPARSRLRRPPVDSGRNFAPAPCPPACPPMQPGLATAPEPPRRAACPQTRTSPSSAT